MADFKTTGYSSPTFNGRGSPHSHTRKGREFAQRLVESENYRFWLHERIEKKTLDPSLERMLWAYAYGRPKEYIEVTTPGADLSDLSSDLLQEKARRLATLLSQLSAATDKAEAARLIAALAEEESSPSPTIQ